MTDTTASADVTTKKPPVFQPQDDWTLISQGAEARIWKIPGTTVKVAKERFSKAYRHPTLDEKLTKSRCRAEGRILEKCRNPKDSNLVIDVPQVLRIEPPVLYLEFLEGLTVREYLEDHLLLSLKDDDDTEKASELHQLAQQIGSMVGKLHTLGCIHGDLTTSNMMLRGSQPQSKRAKTENDNNVSKHKITLIDFGLAKNTTSAEERAVDLYVLERALTSTHPKLPQSFLETIMESYKLEPKKAAEATLQRLEQVRLRGRKRECFG
ncbi:KEOPS complex subunit BUD32 [Seminavis robusta]|uniref:non-specific serine/threonine protein kinase n=1 Tax=Seminavis robusta TaxID=568900 RepID=A0A9N8E8E6_9STRA|nr:KEOPS complex subunit BUD32 [Seminavis robusta]|eukprot:Sro734_g194760.1 KEOPS complex subunit BUD32 (266) ;mRNA; r:40841-41638